MTAIKSETDRVIAPGSSQPEAVLDTPFPTAMRMRASDTRQLEVGNTKIDLPPRLDYPVESLASILRSDRKRGIELLNQSVYDMNRLFPAEERTPAGRFLEALDKGNYDVLLVRDKGKILGGIHQLLLDTPDHGKIAATTYIWVSDKVRSKGLGSQLCELGTRRAEALGAWAQIAEVNDKQIMSRQEKRDDGGTNRVTSREYFWAKNDFNQLDMPYLQPKVSAHGAPATYPALLMKIIGEAPDPEMVNRKQGVISVGKEVAVAIVTAYHREIIYQTKNSNGDALKEDLAHQILARSIRKGPEEIGLISPHRKRSEFDVEFEKLRADLKYPQRA